MSQAARWAYGITPVYNMIYKANSYTGAEKAVSLPGLWRACAFHLQKHCTVFVFLRPHEIGGGASVLHLLLHPHREAAVLIA